MVRGRLFKTILLTATLVCAVSAAVMLDGPPAEAANFPDRTLAASVDFCENNSKFFGLEPWYHFMHDSSFGRNGDPCAVKCFNIYPQHTENACGYKASDIPGVILVIIDDLLRIAALVAVAYIIVGSFEYVASRGNSERAASAQSTIISALTGLAIALVAVALVSFLGNRL